MLEILKMLFLLALVIVITVTIIATIWVIAIPALIIGCIWYVVTLFISNKEDDCVKIKIKYK